MFVVLLSFSRVFTIQLKNGIIKHVNVSVKIIVHANKVIAGILAHVFDKMAII